MTRSPLIILTLLLAVLHCPSLALAQQAPAQQAPTQLHRLLLLETVAPENNPEAVTAAVEVLESALGDQGIEIVRTNEDHDCLVGDESVCIPLLGIHHADAILVVTAYPENGALRPSPVLVIDVFNAQAHVSRSASFLSEPVAVASGLMDECLAQWATAQPVRWTIHGSPDGAAVQVDRELGAIPFTTTVTPGEHHLIVRAPGFATYEEDVFVEAGESALRTEVVLLGRDGGSEEADAEDGDSPTHWQSIVGPVLLGVGVAGAAGVVIGTVATSGDEDTPNGTRHSEVAVGPMLGYAGIGLAVAAVGAVLWVTAPDSPTQVAIGPQQITITHAF